MPKLSTSELEAALRELSGWEFRSEKLHREFQFKNFVEAFGFMTKVALLAEQMDHHPDWSNVYNRVVIDLQTHTDKGVTLKDIDLAKKISSL